LVKQFALGQTLILQPASGPAELSIVSGLMCWWFLVPASGGGRR